MTRDLEGWLADEADRAPELDPTTVSRGLGAGRARVARRRRRTAWVGVGGAVAAVVAVAVTVSVVDPGGGTDSGLEPVAPPATASTSEPTSVPESELPVENVDGEPLVTCGSTSFPASAMADGVPGVLTDAQAREMFRQVAAQPEYEDTEFFFPGGVERVEWRVLKAEGTTYYLGMGRWTDRGPSTSARAFEFRDTPDGWRVGGGYCYDLSPVLKPGHWWLTVTTLVDKAPDDRSVVVGGYERGCTSGRDPQPYLQPVRTVETATSVTIYATTEPIDGGAKCPLGQGTELGVQLDAPLGDRALLDGSTYPPRRISRR